VPGGHRAGRPLFPVEEFPLKFISRATLFRPALRLLGAGRVRPLNPFELEAAFPFDTLPERLSCRLFCRPLVLFLSPYLKLKTIFNLPVQ